MKAADLERDVCGLRNNEAENSPGGNYATFFGSQDSDTHRWDRPVRKEKKDDVLRPHSLLR